MKGTDRLRAMVYQAARTLPDLKRKPLALAAAILIVATVVDWNWIQPIEHWARIIAYVLVVVTVLRWLTIYVLPPLTAEAANRRDATNVNLSAGVASPIDILQFASGHAMRRENAPRRPSIARRDLKTSDVAVEVARIGYGIDWLGGRAHSAINRHTARVGAPQSGKSATLINYGIDAPGGLVVVSTRLDLAEGITAYRLGKPVHMVNPADLGNIPSTLRWSVLDGCENYETALRRASSLIPMSENPQAKTWVDRARDILAALLYLAARKPGGRMGDIQRWISHEGTTPPPDAVNLAKTAPQPAGMDKPVEETLRNHWALHFNGRQSINLSLFPALAWRNIPAAVEIGDSPREDLNFDPARLITNGETMNIVGREGPGGLDNLIACITAEIAHAAEILSGMSTSGAIRALDPPLTMLLDEVALICPVPLPQWTADMGGRGVVLHLSMQSMAQMRERWGETGAATIRANLGALIIFGGSKNTDELESLSALIGKTLRRYVPSSGPDFQSDLAEFHLVPIMDAAALSRMKPFEVVALLPNIPPVLGYTVPAFKRRGWQRHVFQPRQAPQPKVVEGDNVITIADPFDAWEQQLDGGGHGPADA